MSGILYGLSWPIFEWLNLSFLGWIAFVPLFFYLEKNKTKPSQFILGSFGAMFIFGCISACWLFNFPKSLFEIGIIFILEIFWFSCPFLFLYFIKKNISFQKSIWTFPLIWMIWEWVYLHFEFTMGTHLSSYSQSTNLWLIQYIDITGMWGVSFWLILFNVLIYKSIKKFNYLTHKMDLFKSLIYIALFMLGIPFIYSSTKLLKPTKDFNNSIDIRLIPTNYSSEILLNANMHTHILEKILHQTDSIAFHQINRGVECDLFVWPETGINYSLDQSNLEPLLKEAVHDWGSALLTGCKGVPDIQNPYDKRSFVSSVLISDHDSTLQYHHKTILTPGQEALPFYSILSKLSFLSEHINHAKYSKPGKTSRPLELTTSDNKKYKIGASLCFEQWYPNHWAKLSQNGAEVFIIWQQKVGMAILGFKVS